MLNELAFYVNYEYLQCFSSMIQLKIRYTCAIIKYPYLLFVSQTGCIYGLGVYFATDAGFSALHYAKPDSNNRKYIYKAKVLSGDFCAGSGSMKTPPPKNPKNPSEKYDSVVDDVNNPRIWVVFNDHLVYPEYVITFL